MALNALDLGVIIAYLALMRLIGLWATRAHSSRDTPTLRRYLLADRALGGWAVGLSLVGTSISSVTFLAFPGDAFKGTWLRFTPCLALPLALWIVSRWLLPRMGRGAHATAYELLERRFSVGVRRYGAIAFLSAQLARVSVVLYLLALITQSATGLDARLCVLITGGVVALYTARGGLISVVWTDIAQVFVLTLGGALCLYTLVDLIPDGASGLFGELTRSPKLSLSARPGASTDWSLSLAQSSVPMLFFIGLMNWITEYVSNQGALQRLYAARSDRDARLALGICAALSVPIWALFMTLGTALSAFFAQRPDLIPHQVMSGEVSAESILPYFITHYMSPGLMGLALAATLAAAMSSLDSSLNSISSVVMYDLTSRSTHEPTDGLTDEPTDQPTDESSERAEAQQRLVERARHVTLGASGLMLIGALALLYVNTTTLRDAILTIGALLSGGLLSLYLIALLSERPRARHIKWGVASALTCTLWPLGERAGLLECPFDIYYTGLVGNLALVCVTWLMVALDGASDGASGGVSED